MGMRKNAVEGRGLRKSRGMAKRKRGSYAWEVMGGGRVKKNKVCLEILGQNMEGGEADSIWQL